MDLEHSPDPYTSDRRFYENRPYGKEVERN
jgi:hypothetical protein